MQNKKQQLYKIIILGDYGVGKTSLMISYVNAKFALKSKPTIGVDFMVKQISLDDKIMTLQIWDTNGQERFQAMGQAFYRNADCCVLVYDIMNQKSFDSLNLWREDYFTYGQPKAREKFPFVVLGNKLDKASERTVQQEKAQSWCESQKNTKYFEVSALNSTNVQSAFEETIKIVDRQEREIGVFPIALANNDTQKLAKKTIFC